MKRLLIITILFVVSVQARNIPDELVVIGGVNSQITEVVNSSNFKAETKSLDMNVYGSVGFLIDGNPTVCGGRSERKTTSKCHVLTNGISWTTSHELETPRLYASVIQIDANKALVIGGRDANWNDLDTLETITSEGAILSLKTLHFTFVHGCATKINLTHGIIIAGQQNGKTSSKTWLIDLNSQEMSSGPELNKARSHFGCAISKKEVVVGGGQYRSRKLASTEILDLKNLDLTWTQGPDLPTEVFGLSMVESANGILAIGGKDISWNELKSIHRLSCNEGNDCQWKEEGHLNHERSYFNVIPITSELANVLTLKRIPLLHPLLDLFSIIISLFQ